MNKSVSVIFFVALAYCTTISLYAQSPYRTSWEKDGPILGIGCASSAVGLALYESVSSPTAMDISQLSSGSVNWFDRSATSHYSESAASASNVLFAIAAAAPLALFTDATVRDDWRPIMLMYVETWSFIGGTSTLSKGLIERYRPYVYNPDVSMDKKLTSDAKKSFFSNHTTTAFASAVFLSTVYGDYHPDSEWRPYIWAGSLLMASVVGYLRYEAGEHYPTDILTGAAVGSAIGYIIPWMHRSDKETVSVTPGVPHADYGFSIHMKF